MPEPLEDHIGWLADRRRMRALSAAISAIVTSGDVVLDLGAGTGILGLLACRAGAARVYAIEHGPIIELARKLARANGFHDRIHFIKGHSRSVTLPERADVLVCDLIGPFGFEAGLFETLSDARARLLKPGARTIPSALSLFVAPIELPSLRRHLQFTTSPVAGLDMTALAAHACRRAYQVYPSAESVLAAPALIGRYEATSALPTLDMVCRFQATRPGSIDAIAGWFEADLTSGVSMTNAPGSAERLERAAVALPVSPPMTVASGDELTMRFRLLSADRIYSWQVQRTRAGDDPNHFAGSTFEGLLLAREDLDGYRGSRS